MDPQEFQAQLHEIDKTVTEIRVDLKYVKEKIDRSEGVHEKNTADLASHIRRTDLLEANQDAVLQTLTSMTETMKEMEEQIKPMARHLMLHAWASKGLYYLFGGSLLAAVLNFATIFETLSRLF